MHAPHQAQGLQRLFSGHSAPWMVSVLAAPQAPDSHEFTLKLADALSGRGQRVWLVDTGAGELSASLGCRPLLHWQSGRPLDGQVIGAGRYGLLFAPGCLAGDAAIASAAAGCRSCDFLLFDSGRFSRMEAPLAPATAQTLVVLLGEQDHEAGYALLKALVLQDSPAKVLLVGKAADSVAQAARRFLNQTPERPEMGGGLCQNGNNRPETSSNTLTIEPNLPWLVSRIMQNDQARMMYGGCGKGAEEIDQQ